jgi:hypothetical protein
VLQRTREEDLEKVEAAAKKRMRIVNRTKTERNQEAERSSKIRLYATKEERKRLS